jgi:hypothetical protein
MKYRSRYIVNTDKPFYAIERFKNNKWRFCFAEFDSNTANMLINNPDLIELQIKTYKITGICVCVFILFCITYLFIKN